MEFQDHEMLLQKVVPPESSVTEAAGSSEM
jgi:hypothetical protein